MPPFMWSLGSIVGAAMGGYLAEPSHYYPSLFPPDGVFGEYPYLLPNLVAVAFIMVALVQGYVFLKETNPRFQSPKGLDENSGPVDERTPLQPKARRGSVMDSISTGPRRLSFISGSMPTMSEPSFDIRRGSVTTLHEIHEIKPTVSQSVDTIDTDTSSQPIKAFNHAVILWIIAIVIMCYHQMASISLLPIYFLDSPERASSLDLKGGLGYTVHDVGTFMSVNGVIALIIQVAIFPHLRSPSRSLEVPALAHHPRPYDLHPHAVPLPSLPVNSPHRYLRHPRPPKIRRDHHLSLPADRAQECRPPHPLF